MLSDLRQPRLLFSFFFFWILSPGPAPLSPAESPLISLRLPSARGEIKIDSPPGNCSSLTKEKWEAVSWALSKDVHPSPFEVDDKVAPESARRRLRLRGDEARGRRRRSGGPINPLVLFQTKPKNRTNFPSERAEYETSERADSFFSTMTHNHRLIASATRNEFVRQLILGKNSNRQLERQTVLISI